MIQKKRVELYMQRRARLSDTHEDVGSDFEDFDMNDCDFKLDGTEQTFEYQCSPEQIKEAYIQKTPMTEDTGEPSIMIGELPSLEMNSINKEAFAAWQEKNEKEKALNNMDKGELRHNIHVERGLETNKESQQPLREFHTSPKGSRAEACDVTAAGLLHGGDIITCDELTRDKIRVVCRLTLVFKKLIATGLPLPQLLSDRILSYYFQEPSTRTRCSFEAAAYRLGGKVLVVDNEMTNSTVKGESFYDTVRILGSYGDGMIIRAREAGAITTVAKHMEFPIISAGDGTGEHPTQALLDIVTMVEELPTLLDPKRATVVKVTFLGDLKNGRTVHSLAKALSILPKMELCFIAPPEFQIDNALADQLRKTGTMISRTNDMNIDTGRSDFIYATRLQTERLDTVKANSSAYNLKLNLISLIKIQAKPSLRIMHPLPRNDEISTDIDSTDHQLYFTQAENGVYTRMALLALVFSNQRKQIEDLLKL